MFVFDCLENVSYVVHLVALAVSQAGRGISGHGESSGQFAGAMFWKWTLIDTVPMNDMDTTWSHR